MDWERVVDWIQHSCQSQRVEKRPPHRPRHLSIRLRRRAKAARTVPTQQDYPSKTRWPSFRQSWEALGSAAGLRQMSSDRKCQAPVKPLPHHHLPVDATLPTRAQRRPPAHRSLRPTRHPAPPMNQVWASYRFLSLSPSMRSTLPLKDPAMPSKSLRQGIPRLSAD